MIIKTGISSECGQRPSRLGIFTWNFIPGFHHIRLERSPRIKSSLLSQTLKASKHQIVTSATSPILFWMDIQNWVSSTHLLYIILNVYEWPLIGWKRRVSPGPPHITVPKTSFFSHHRHWLALPPYKGAKSLNHNNIDNPWYMTVMETAYHDGAYHKWWWPLKEMASLLTPTPCST